MSGFYGQKKSIKRPSNFDDSDEAFDPKVHTRPHNEGDGDEQNTVAPPQKKVTKKISSSSGEIQFELTNNRKISVTGKTHTGHSQNAYAHAHTCVIVYLCRSALTFFFCVCVYVYKV